jgi:hypothetical protein
MLAAAVVSLAGSYAEARQFYIRNESSDSFRVSVLISDPRVTITHLISTTDPSEIAGRTREMCGKAGIRCEKRYDITFKDGYIPLPGEEPFILFQSDKGEFRIVFFDEYYLELQSSMASEIHDDTRRRESELLYTKDPSLYQGKNEFEGNVRHWIAFGPYVGVCCYERYYFPRRCVDICDALDDNAWIQTIKEAAFDLRVGIDPPHRHMLQSPKQHWWSRFFCCSCDE